MKEFDLKEVPIQDRKMVRNMHSKAVLSTDVRALQAHKDKVKAFEKMQDMNTDINTLKEDMSEIKDLLIQLLRNKE